MTEQQKESTKEQVSFWAQVAAVGASALSQAKVIGGKAGSALQSVAMLIDQLFGKH